MDDEEYLADLVATALRYEGFDTRTTGSHREAIRHTREFRPDLIVLDVLLPDGSGMDTCRQLRRDGVQTPVLFLTARDATEDKITGLSIGGDDYLTKPFSLQELIARVRVVLRRTQPSKDSAKHVFADLELDEDAYQVRRAGVLIELTPTEFTLLRYLLINAGRVLTKRQILEHVWEYDFGGNDAVVQTYISYLRRKVDATEPALIHTVPRVGYALRLPERRPD
ncbi:two-component system OmpR family response regulator [Tamaricihabitans halophyticus]|uniref:Two-component system OmpR family response regulator n=1 Tax=Tamaricihabitans halophyticus TaxID=1262583 RepID=A0A4R2QZX8_9PSEU|nr:two-component system OmpR family response regulator [Tamaricihabitans halophyticus]